MKSTGMEDGLMVELLLGALGILIALAGLSVYSALRLAKRTDEMVTATCDEQPETPLMVRFPEAVFKKPTRTEAGSREG